MKTSFLQKPILVLLISILFSPTMQAQVFNGDLTLSSQAEANSFNYTEVTGNLNISGADITDLSPLSTLATVGGGINIQNNNALVNLNGLSSLSSVGSEFFIGNNPVLEGINGFTSLNATASNLNVSYNPVLSSLQGFNNLTSVGNILKIDDNPLLSDLSTFSSLTSVGGNFWIRDMVALTDFSDFSALTSVGGVSITGNTALTEFCALFPALNNGFAGSYTVTGNAANPTLQEILDAGPCPVVCMGDVTLSSQAEVDAFACDEITGNLTITGADITDLSPLSALTTVGGDLYINENPALTNVDGLSSLTSVGGIFEVFTNVSLTSLNGVNSLTSVGKWVNINNNYALITLEGLSSLSSVTEGFYIQNSDALTSIDGLSSLVSIGTEFYIYKNSSLTNVDGLSALTSVGGSVSIHDNDALLNLDGLSSLTSVGVNLTIDENGSLIEFCGLHPLLSGGGLGGSYSVSNNAANPTQQEILDAGPCGVCPDGNTIFVNDDANGANTGSSWDNAFNDLQDALALAANCGDVSQIWVAAGMYKPTDGADRGVSFEMKNNLAIYGGFDGTEDPQTFDLSTRDFMANETILSGDIGVQNDSTDNSQNIVRSIENDNTAMLDGFTIRQGQADLGVGRGGGVLVINGTTVIKNCHITDNYALGGAGISIEGVSAQPSLEDCNIEGNRSQGGGGGTIVGFGASPVFETCTFSGNQGGLGGGVSVFSNGSNPVFNNCVFQGNTSLDYGGGVSSIADAMPGFNTCTFTQNTAAGSGGGVYSTGKSISFNNCSFSQNTAEGGGGAVQAGGQPLTFVNCEFTQNTSTGAFGGAINGSAGLIITDCLFEGNSAPEGAGGAINFGNVAGTFTGTTFLNNTALGAGALAYYAFNPNVVAANFNDCLFQGNNASAGGGAVWNGFGNTDGSTEMIFSNCTFLDNTVFDGTDLGTGGAYQGAQVGHNATFTNCLLDGNKALGSADDGGGAFMIYEGVVNIVNSTLVNNESASHGGAISVFDNNDVVNVKNSILWSNSASTDNNIYNGNGGTASIEYSLLQEEMCPPNVNCGDGMLYNSDPLFADANDFHFQACSPAIDAGTNDGAPDADLDGNPRPFSPGGLDPAMTDMGCYEYSISEDLCATCATVAFAGEDAVILAGETYALADATAENYTALVWETSGDGTFDDENAVNPTYFPGVADNNNGSVVLTLSLEGLSSCGVGAADDMTLMLNSPPTVEITNPMEGDVLYSNMVSVEGTAADVDGNLAEVYLMLNDGDWILADGTDNWTGDLTLVAGENQIKAKSVDALGLESDIAEVNVVASYQLVPIAAGWSLISSFLSPTDPAIDQVMQHVSIPGNLTFMLSQSGIYWPEFNINTIGDWKMHEGYKVKLNEPDELMIGGDKLTDNSISLLAGNNIIPVLTDMPAQISQIFANPEDDIDYLFDLSTGTVFWPEGEIYSLSELIPGKGYFGKFNKEVTLDFPDYQNLKSASIPAVAINEQTSPWSYSHTAEVHLISIFKEAIVGLEDYSHIGAFNSNGHCIGSADLSKKSSNVLLTLFGDDAYTEFIDGAVAGDLISFRAFNPITDEETEIEPVFSNKFPNHDGLFALNGLSAISDFKALASGISGYDLFSAYSIYPNPAAADLNITFNNFDSDADIRVELVNSTGSVVLTRDILYQSTKLNIQNLQPGMYVLKIIQNGEYSFKKLVIQ